MRKASRTEAQYRRKEAHYELLGIKAEDPETKASLWAIARKYQAKADRLKRKRMDEALATHGIVRKS